MNQDEEFSIPETVCNEAAQENRYSLLLVKEVIKSGWTRDNGAPLPDIISRCCKMLAQWKKEHLNNSKKEIENLKAELEHEFKQSVPNARRIKEVRHSLQIAYQAEEKYWKQKSRIFWLQEGDKNTKFFHGCAKIRQARNQLVYIKDEHGNEYHEEEDIAKAATDYFTSLFQSDNTIQDPNYFSNIECKVSEVMNATLTREVTEEEIKQAAFSIGSDRAPGPDGMNGAFYKQYWSIVSGAVISEVQKFFQSGTMTSTLNHTNLVLIPKHSDTRPETMKDFRPISLCNVASKIISKILVGRMKTILPKIISDSQSAFVPGRNIADNILIAHELTHSLHVRKRQSKSYMAVKTDISKAYDRVEWSFLRQAILSLGFCEQWTNWLMACVSSVTYSVLINGSPYGYVQPQRDIRQGDPLSPYLFLLCAEILSQKVDTAQRLKHIQGLSISIGGPRVTHLFFADDSLFFCCANDKDSKNLASILNLYAKYSGQLVNFDKSSITCGSKVHQHNIARVQHNLRITSLGGCGTYLGLPEQFGRRKVEMFQYIVERVKERTTGWNNKFLSAASKEILLKSVALAMPVYSMNCFKLPTTICDEITSILSSFWWGTKDGKRKISYVSWERMSLPKNQGGLGFRDLANFNQALLGKQAWRIFNSPNSLLYKVLKSRYFQNEDFLNATKGSQPSFGWTSMLHGRDLLKQGMRWQLGNGNISAFHDVWVPCHPPKSLSQCSLPSHLCVKDLWLNNQWNMELLEEISPIERDLIKHIYLSKIHKVDRQVWHYTKDGVNTVKSGYWLASQERETLLQPPIGDIEIKKSVWSSSLAPKLKMFLWRTLSHALGTASSLTSRGIPVDPLCQRCHADIETPNHVLFTCPNALSTWSLLPINPFRNSPPLLTVDDNFKLLFSIPHTNTSMVVESIHFWLLWSLWKSRNDFIFNARAWDPHDILRRAQIEANEWIAANSSTSQTPDPSTQHPRLLTTLTWSPPPQGWLKCNHDATHHPLASTTGEGWIIRNDRSSFICAASSQLPKARSALEAEGFSLLHAMQIAWSRGYHRMIFESDSKQLVDLLNHHHKDIAMENLLYDINHWRTLFAGVHFLHVKRELNVIADSLAYIGQSQSISCCIYHSMPTGI